MRALLLFSMNRLRKQSGTKHSKVVLRLVVLGTCSEIILAFEIIFRRNEIKLNYFRLHNFFSIFAEKIMWDVVRGPDRNFCRSIFIPAYNVLSIACFTNVTDDFVEGVLLCISRMWLVCWFSLYCFMHVC